MFSWICPQCGREVPPSYTECPDCAAKAKAAPPAVTETPQPGAPPPPPQHAQPQYTPPPPQQAYAPQPQYAPAQPYPAAPPQAQYPPPPYQQQYAPPPPYAAPRRAARGGLPTWLLTVVFALAFVGLVGAIYWTVGYFRGGSQAAAPPSVVESPSAKPGAKTSPYQKYVEISGIRFAQDGKKNMVVHFTVTNHSDADLSGLAGNVTMWARTQKAEEDAVGTFAFKTDVPPQSSREVTAPLTTKLKIYELPDWQNVTTDLQITAPQ